MPLDHLHVFIAHIVSSIEVFRYRAVVFIFVQSFLALSTVRI